MKHFGPMTKHPDQGIPESSFMRFTIQGIESRIFSTNEFEAPGVDSYTMHAVNMKILYEVRWFSNYPHEPLN